MNPNELSLLVVEPSDLQRKIIVKELKQQGITQVSEAKSIAEAYASAETHPRDLITSAMYFDDGTALESTPLRHYLHSLCDFVPRS